MMNKLLVTFALVGYAMAGPLSGLGGVAEDVNIGLCLAFQDNPADTNTACYIACQKTGPKIVSFFDTVDFTNSNSMTTAL